MAYACAGHIDIKAIEGKEEEEEEEKEEEGEGLFKADAVDEEDLEREEEEDLFVFWWIL